MASKWKYLPILKWKQGERIAVSKLTQQQWEPIVVLAEPMAIDSAPDGQSLRAALPPYLQKLGTELGKAVPSHKPIAVDTRYVSQGYTKQIRLLSVTCKALKKEAERDIIPVLRASTAVTEATDLGVLLEHAELILRIDVNSTDPSQIAPLVKLLTDAGFKKGAIHLLLDQESLVNALPATQMAKMSAHALASVQTKVASVTVAGGSFPANLIGVKQGIVDFSRVEWHVWKLLIAQPELAGVLRYGDYTVSNPNLPPAVDPKLVNPSVAIRYASDGFWRVFKAGGFKGGTPNQYRSLCGLLLLDAIYSTASFSYGDDCYEKAANAKLGNGNPSSWRRDATSHHLVYTAAAL